MTFTHATALNKYGVTSLIVATDPANGSHTTLNLAMAAAVAGQTIFLRDSVTENVTITPGVNIVGLASSSGNVPSISGTLTMVGAGTSTISDLELITNSAPIIAVTGSAASVLNVNDCYLNMSNNTGITYSSSSTSSCLNFNKCNGNIGTIGIGIFTATGAGFGPTASNISSGGMYFSNCVIGNSGASTTASTTSACGVFLLNCHFYSPFASTGAASYTIRHTHIGNTNQNTTCLTTAGTGTTDAEFSEFYSGSASAISIGAGTIFTIDDCVVISTNTNTITGAGTILNGIISFGSGLNTSVINTTTQTTHYSNLGKYKASGQPAFFAYQSGNVTNVTGDATVYTIIFGEKLFDQNSNFNTTTGTFTAPVTGIYQFNVSILAFGATTSDSAGSQLVIAGTSARVYNQNNNSVAIVNDNALNFSLLVPMTATDTANVTIFFGGSTKTVGVYGNSAADPRTSFSGYLVG